MYIRGATTIEQDVREEIQSAVKELLEEIVSHNTVKKEEIECLIFSSTGDIHSYYPAKAAREAGFESSALFSAVEPDIDGALPLCIRVLVIAKKEATPRHVYLRGAKLLRKDVVAKLNIAIDGPAGSGKSTVAHILADDYHILHLDSGALYRACALKAIKNKIDGNDEEAVSRMMAKTAVTAEYTDGAQRTMLDGQDVTDELRTSAVSMAASAVSRYRCVREALLQVQRDIAEKLSCVLDGRDIGTCVLPHADYKFFLTADVEVRARRRYEELCAKGEAVDFEQLKAEIAKRDEQDATRKWAPLKKAEDALEIDTSHMTVEEVVAAVKHKIQEKI